MRRERMAHRVAGGSLGDLRLPDSLLHVALHGSLVEVVAGDPSGARVQISSPRQKSVPFHTN
jgi:hypothetical protein